ncbi:MAG TPA: PAS domain-containing protein [Lacipirellulaceae bacterium]|nr:PAS domain-containing protein [Lacipirellulaceae bacterium]
MPRRAPPPPPVAADPVVAPTTADGVSGMWDWDVTSGAVQFDQRWAEIFGEPAGDLLMPMEQWLARIHPEDFPSARMACQKHLIGQTEQYEATIRVRHRDGRWRWVLDRGRVVVRDVYGQPIRMVGSHVDITGEVKPSGALAVCDALSS